MSPAPKSASGLVARLERRGTRVATREGTCRAASDGSWDVAARSDVAEVGPGHLAAGGIDDALPEAIRRTARELVAKDHEGRGGNDNGRAKDLHVEEGILETS